MMMIIIIVAVIIIIITITIAMTMVAIYFGSKSFIPRNLIIKLKKRQISRFVHQMYLTSRRIKLKMAHV